jgi:8-oxo-dGTP diphosphatase
MKAGGVLIVTAALIERDGKLLVCRRPPGGRQAGLWEFPGGTVEAGEDPREALRRELGEELGVEAEIGGPVEVIFHRYEFGDVLLLFFRTKVTAGNPEPLHHTEICWAQPSELKKLEFLPADCELIRKLEQGL